MKNAFEILGIPARLVIDAEALGTAFREVGKTTHPDAGGDDNEFAALRGALEIVASPSKRLKHWLEIMGAPVELRGSVDPLLMDLFSEIGAVTQRAEALIRKRDESKSALGLALLERETQTCREAVEKTIQLVDASIGRECSIFPTIENSTAPDIEVASRTVRNLSFLEKWRAGMRGVFSRLV
jgi:curved DNA-binding protein CbpA